MLYHKAISELHHEVEAESVDIILTDPPYPKEYLDTWRDLASFAEHALKDGGHLVAMSGKTWLPEVFAIFSESDLKYRWTLEFRMDGKSNGMIGRRIYKTYWKPLLWYIKGSPMTYPILDMVRDADAPEEVPIDEHIYGVGRDKKYHYWGQPSKPFVELIERLAREKIDGEIQQNRDIVVCDPFVGGGATAEAAKVYGCQFIGADIDDACIKTTEERLANYTGDLFNQGDEVAPEADPEPEVEQLTIQTD